MKQLLSRFILPLVLAAFVAAPAYAHHGGGGGDGGGSGSAICGGSASSSSFLGLVSMNCSGDYAISGKTLSAGLNLLVDAGEDLTLTNVRFDSPFIELVAGNGSLTVNGSSTFGGLDWDIVGNSITAAAHVAAPVVFSAGSALFDGIAGHQLATPSRITWEIFSVPGAHGSGPVCDLPGLNSLGDFAGLSLLALAPQLLDGSGSVFLEVAGKGGILLTVTPVPEPGTGTLALAGVLLLAMIVRRRSRG